MVYMPTVNSHVNHKYGTQRAYDNLAGKDSNTIYFTTDSRKIYVGDVEYTKDLIDIQWQSGYINKNGSEGSDVNRIRTGYIPCDENIQITYKAETNHNNISALTAYDANKNVIATNVNIGACNTEYTFTTPTGTRLVRLSSTLNCETSVNFSAPIIVANVAQNVADIAYMKKLHIAYVANDGSDNNNGDQWHPFATVNHALQSKADCIVIKKSGVYEQTIDLSNAFNKKVTIVNGVPTGRVIFRPSNSLLTDNETLVSGYTHVYSATVSATFATQNKWIFQDGVADESTLISDSERLPLERGYTYRCEDTKIEKCTAQTTSEAVEEIESDDIYKWFYDSSNSTLYFSRPQTVTSGHPIRGSFGTTLFSGATDASRSITLNIIGIETKYMIFNITDTSDSHIIDCKSTNVYGDGAFVYNRCVGAKFERCEAARCFSGANGDGFNAHSNNTGEIYSKQTTVSLIDCWSHDNNDDGYSDHERSETTIIGGLYEYNGKGGVTPSYGSHCNCYHVHSRHNYNGFLYVGSAAVAEGGKYGQLYCNSCVAEYNTAGGTKMGFRISDAGNSAVLVNCKSIGNIYGYYADTKTHGMKLIDCGGKDNQHDKFGNITIENTTIIS